MLSSNYEIHLSNLGRMCKAYDDATAFRATADVGQLNVISQVSTSGLFNEANNVAAATSEWTKRIQNGLGSLGTTIQNLAGTYLTDPEFTSTVVTTIPTDPTPAQVMDAWILDMGNDSATFTTASGAGLVHFFNLFDPTGVIPQSGSPVYPDSTYVI